jgi:hypothetical protein
MNTLNTERLYDLLPAVYRLRDNAQGKPLESLLAAFARELGALEENVAQLYDDQFIETCADWVAPYIGDLIGYRPLHGVTPQVASPRAEVANTIAYRRRKGTALMLEQLASDVTGWPAHVVEYFELLVCSQYMNHPRLHAQAAANLRNTTATLRVGSAFDAFSHVPEMRRPQVGGRHNIPNIGIFLWRLMPLRLDNLPLVPHPGDATGRKFRVNPLGADMRLFRNPQSEQGDISHISEPINVPEQLSVRLMALAVKAARASTLIAPDDVLIDDYGRGESIQLQRPLGTAVSVNDIRICDLRDIRDAGGTVIGWNHEAALAAGEVGIDPERGRILLGAAADGVPVATFHYGTAALIGGGSYARVIDGQDLPTQENVSNGAALQSKLDSIATGGRLTIEDSRTYSETPIFKAAAGKTAVVSAADGFRPLIAASGDVKLEVGVEAHLVIEGLVISGGALKLAAAADDKNREIILRDCTLVPGSSLNPDGTAASPGVPSLIIEHPFARVVLERCITGPLAVAGDAEVSLKDCIVDAGDQRAVAYRGTAVGSLGAALSAEECTFIGKVRTQLMQLASSCIFFAVSGVAGGDARPEPVIASRRQEGCMRFSYVPEGSVTPRRFRCVPDEAHPDAVPHFVSLRYGGAAYGQLRRVTDLTIRAGGEDESEMGVMHHLHQPQKEKNLEIRLDEYLRFGLGAGLFFAS